MIASAIRPIRLATDQARRTACDAVMAAPDGWIARIGPPTRTLDQNALFHALVADIARARPEWSGVKMDADDWKALLVVSHSIATSEGEAVRLVPDLEGNGLVQLRESTARMSKARGSSLIEYVVSWAASHGIRLTTPDREEYRRCGQ